MKQRIFWVLALATPIWLALAGCQGGPETAPTGEGATQATPMGDPGAADSSVKAQQAAFAPAAVGTALLAMQDDANRLAEDLSLESQQKKAESKAKVETARKLMNDLKYQEAERLLEQAVRLDPNNAEARRELDRVLFILGDRRGEIRDVATEEADREKVRRQQAEVELKRMIIQGRGEMESGKFEEAALTFEKVLESIEWFHYNLDLGDLKTQAQALKTSAEDRGRKAERDRREALEKLAEESAEAEADRSMRFVQNRIEQLMRKADQAYTAKDYEDVMELTDQVIELDRTNRAARRLNKKAAELRHLHEVTRSKILTREEWDRSFLSQLESEVPYEKIFNFPDRAAWDAISRKSVSLEERILGTETSEERNIKVALEQPVDVEFDDQPFGDVIDFLHSISGINFVLTQEARDQVEDADDPVSLAAVKGLPLRNVLRLVLDSRDPKFNYILQDGAVLIGPADSLKEELFLEFYEVSDITKSPPDFKAPKLALADTGDDSGGGGSVLDIDEDTDTGAVTVDVEQLIELIEESLGGEDEEFEGSVKAQSGKLVVRTTLANHQKIQKLLTALRKSTGIMVTVESRFIDLQDNFLESIGVDFGNPFNSNLPNPINDIDGNGTQMATGYEWIDAQGQTNVRAASFEAFSQPLGTSVAPFNISDRGGFGLQYNVLDNYILEAILTANAKTQEFRRLDAPRVTAFNTQTSHSLIIEQEAYIRDAEVNQTGVIPVINPVIGILNAGSILEVRPTVSYDRKYVILEIRPTLAVQLPSRFKRLTLGFTNLDVELPVLSVTKVNTTVTVPDGGTVLVGGLKRTITQKAQVGVPWFRDLPFFDILLGRKGQTRLQSNLFVLINAKITVIRDEERQEFN